MASAPEPRRFVSQGVAIPRDPSSGFADAWPTLGQAAGVRPEEWHSKQHYTELAHSDSQTSTATTVVAAESPSSGRSRGGSGARRPGGLDASAPIWTPSDKGSPTKRGRERSRRERKGSSSSWQHQQQSTSPWSGSPLASPNANVPMSPHQSSYFHGLSLAPASPEISSPSSPGTGVFLPMTPTGPRLQPQPHFHTPHSAPNPGQHAHNHHNGAAFGPAHAQQQQHQHARGGPMGAIPYHGGDMALMGAGDMASGAVISLPEELF